MPQLITAIVVSAATIDANVTINLRFFMLFVFCEYMLCPLNVDLYTREDSTRLGHKQIIYLFYPLLGYNFSRVLAR